ncbi:MAG: SurA N-terminal domain-containing protein [Nitrospiraceae bacterium]|nr:SurA N-terminal domain-containing protein [Nitrospiraceae bacterium]
MNSGRTLFLALFLLAIVAFASSARAFSGPFVLDRVAAVVNRDVITWAEFYRAMQFDYAPQMRSLSNEEKLKFLKQKEAGYLDKMIDMALQIQEAKKQNLEVSDKEIDEAIASIKKKYSMDDKAFAQALKAEGFSVDEYRRRLSEQILVSKVVTREVRDKLSVSPQEVQAYISKNGLRTASGDDEVLKLSQIFFQMPQDPAAKAAVEKKADEALGKVRSGGDFMTIARMYSQADPDIGVVKRGLLSGNMLSVLDKMKPGDVSKPFWTGQGLYIIKLDDRISSAHREELMAKVKKELMDADFEKAYKSWLRQLREDSYVEVRL